MPYDEKLAERLRKALAHLPNVEEKKMFRGLAFMVNGKMCLNVSGDQLMCRYDPTLTQSVALNNGYAPMIMKGKELKGYCYVSQDGLKTEKDFKHWVDLALDFNKFAKASRKTGKSK